MASYRTTRFLSVSLVIIIVAVAVVGLVYIARILFFSGGQGVLSQSDTSQAALINTSADRAVLMKVRGNIVADEEFRTYQIQITPNQRTFSVYKGYLDQQIKNKVLSNNIPAYEQFVYALNRAKLMNANVLTGDSNDTRGICATGFLYEFQILKADKTVKSLWTTTCSSSKGSLGVSLSPVRSLFNAQIPDVQPEISEIWQ